MSIRTLKIPWPFIVRRMFCKVLTNPLNRVFVAAAKNLGPGHSDDFLATQLSSYAGVSRWPQDWEFEAGWSTFPIYASSRAMCRAVLLRLEQVAAKKEFFQATDLEIEHVLPQKPGSEWEAQLSTEEWKQIREYVDTIGNLTLTGYNSEMSNAPFQKKVPLLCEQSQVALNKYFKEQRAMRWGIDEIKKRSESLFRDAMGLWKGMVAS